MTEPEKQRQDDAGVDGTADEGEFGDDFDDFEEGGDGDDFGDFDDGFQGEEAAETSFDKPPEQSPVPVPSPGPVSRHYSIPIHGHFEACICSDMF